jgi:spore maturation protein CgeB
MKVLLVGPYYSNAKHGAEVGIFDALKACGHEVGIWDYRTKTFTFTNGTILGSIEADLPADQPDLDMNYDVVVVPGAGLVDSVLHSKLWKSIKGTKVLWNSEPVRLENYAGRVARNKADFDFFCTFDESEIPVYKKRLGIDAHWLPQAFNPNWYKPLNLPHSQTTRNFAFIGSVGPKWDHRQMFLQRVDSQFALTTALIFDAQVVNRVYNSHLAVLNLGLYLPEFGPMVDFRGEGLQQRIFEAIGSGKICITNEINKGTNQLFTDREDIVYYNSDNLEEVLAYVLTNDKERERMEANVLAIREQHSYEARMRTLFLDILDS